MILKEIFSEVKIVDSNIDWMTNIEMLSMHHKTNNKNILFFSICGSTFDPHSQLKDAILNGAVCIVTENILDDKSLPYIRVKDIRKTMTLCSKNFYQIDKLNLKFIGISGTNGKTTTANMIGKTLENIGKRVAIIGTLGVYIHGKMYESEMTTPDPIELFSAISMAAESLVEYVIMEVSAHAIFYKKVCGLRFEVAVFTNLTQDHLDFFGTMEKYGRTKQSFFEDMNVKNVVINIDDHFGAEMYGSLNKPKIGCGIDCPSDIFAVNIASKGCRTHYFVNYMDELESIYINFLGKFNVMNSLETIATLKFLNYPLTKIAKSLEQVPPVDGRFNFITGARDIVIDYAHTPDGLKNLLRTARNLCSGRLVCVFGCGGNRDRSKRPIMGKIASDLCDFTIITSDNPRLEIPNDIIKDIEKGINDINNDNNSQNKMTVKPYLMIEDRTEAILSAIKMTTKNDLIIIAGKGAENYIDINNIKIKYSDKDTVENILNVIK